MCMRIRKVHILNKFCIGPGRHTDADGWIKLATEFWEEQCK